MHEVVYGGGPTEWLERTGTDSICALDNYVAAFMARENLQFYRVLAVASGHVNSRRAESHSGTSWNVSPVILKLPSRPRRRIRAPCR